MPVTWGTSHFVSLAAAIRYYRPYGYDASDVRAKLASGEIHLGEPSAQPSSRVILDNREGRYFIVTNDGAHDG